MSERIRVGVFGVGSLGQHHARIYSELEGAELVGVCDLDAARAADVAARCGCRAFADADALAAAVDAASVVVPADKHYDVFTRLASRGLHLLVEKPIASTLEEAEAMVAAASEKELVLQVGHIERFNPVMQFLDEHLVHPRFIEAVRLSPYPPPRPPHVPRGTEVSVVLDLMIHDLEIILHLVRSPVATLHALGFAVLSPSEDIANARIVFENGCVANVTASRVGLEGVRKIRIFQEDSYCSLDYTEQSAKICRPTATGVATEPVPIARGDALTNELAAFLECVRTRSDPLVTGQMATQALKLAVDICHLINREPA